MRETIPKLLETIFSKSYRLIKTTHTHTHAFVVTHLNYNEINFTFIDVRGLINYTNRSILELPAKPISLSTHWFYCLSLKCCFKKILYYLKLYVLVSIYIYN